MVTYAVFSRNIFDILLYIHKHLFVYIDKMRDVVHWFVWSVLLYGSETWCLTKEDIRKLEAMEVWIWRGIERIAWTDHITNGGVLEGVQESRQLINLIKERQAEWIGHVMRSDTLLKDILEGRTKGKSKVAGQDRKC